jgi:hypothetical protein
LGASFSEAWSEAKKRVAGLGTNTVVGLAELLSHRRRRIADRIHGSSENLNRHAKMLAPVPNRMALTHFDDTAVGLASVK